jgi:hypothetical protein
MNCTNLFVCLSAYSPNYVNYVKSYVNLDLKKERERKKRDKEKRKREDINSR